MSNSFFPDEEGSQKPEEETINNYLDLFQEYLENKASMPTLEQALKEMFTLCGVSSQDSNEYIKYIRSKTRGRIGNFFEKIKKISPDISFEEAETIASYTSEAVPGGSEYSPYKLLNKNLVSEDRKSGLKKISKYFLFYFQL